MMRISIEEYRRLTNKQPKEEKRYKTICPICQKPIKEDESFSCEAIEGIDPIEVIKRHLLCALSRQN